MRTRESIKMSKRIYIAERACSIGGPAIIFSICMAIISGKVEAHMPSFCAYHQVFIRQIALNRIRMVPFNRVDDFNYFGDREAEFMRNSAAAVYQINESTLTRSLSSILQNWNAVCLEVFGDD